MRVDLHTHSRASDGTQSPRELMVAARAAGLDVIALTDHDTAAGWDEAAAAAEEVGVVLVRGMEISTRHHGRGQHLLGYLPDPAHPALARLLDAVLDGRRSRLPETVGRLRSVGVEITVDDVRRASGHSVVSGRPHVADALVALGVVEYRNEAFARFLNPGRPAYVDRYAAPLVETIAALRSAGGVAVLAHPWGRRRDRTPSEQTFADLAAAGLTGIEVDHQEHDPSAREALRAIARNLGLVVTGSSDHHGTGKTDHELGCNTTAVSEYERLLEAVREVRATSDQATGSAGAPGSAPPVPPC